MKLRRNGISMRTVGNETVVLDLESSRYLTVTGAGVRLLDELATNGDVSVTHLVEVLVAEYEVSTEVARQDIERFESRLRTVGLLVE